MLSCPIGVDWTVTRHDDRVRLHDPVRYDSLDTAEAVRFPEATVDLADHEYRREIAAFAAKAKEPFLRGREKTPPDAYEEELYNDFWQEFDERLGRAEATLHR